MNRKEELQQLRAELEASVPSLEASLEKAKKRKQRRNLVLRPLGSVAAAFVLFVLLVNYCAPVAYACSKVPVLRELAEAVTFSRSLSAAVENDYVQEMNLVQTKNDITAEIAYLIVDQKQVNVFYRLYSDKYQHLDADPDVLSADGSGAERCAWSSGSSAGQEQGLHHITIDYVDADVPDSLRLVLRVRDLGCWESNEEAPEQLMEDSFFDDPDPLPDYLEEFDFLLEFDPNFTETGKVIPLDREVLLDGQAIILETLEIYPTHLRLEVRDGPDNTAWLKDLDFYVQTEDGMVFSSDISGITATGDGEDDSESMVSYRAESNYFYDAEQLSLVITGAEWLDKSRARIWVDLVTGESDPLPEGVTFEKAEKQINGWYVSFRVEHQEGEPMQQVFSFSAYDGEGRLYEINRSGTTYGDPDENGEYTYYLSQFPLKDYPYDEVWLEPTYTHTWEAAEPVVIEVK